MTMANSTVASPMRSSASLRKTNKPLMEKRRRARINDSLTQLKSLVISSSKKDSSQFNKLEKADILELTVKHLRNLQNQQQLQQRQQQQQQQQQQLAGAEPSIGPKYQDGFMECANEVIRYLGQAQGFSDDTKCRVINHLASCIQLANNKASIAKVMHANATMNTGNATATTAILSGAPATTVPAPGQIIQIVPFQAATTGKTQNVQILPSPQTTVLGNSGVNVAAPQSVPAPAPTGTPAATLPNHPVPTPHYAQPLHIQIPPTTFSPVLVANAKPTARPLAQKQQQHQFHQAELQQQQHQPMDITPKLTSTTTNSTPHLISKQPHLERSIPNNTSEDATSPAKTRPLSPAASRQLPQQQQQQQHTPITHVHKIHGFYSSSEDFIPSRPRTYSTASSSSSSSSSTENELASPLNLSQSPGHFNTESLRRKNGDGPMKPRHFMDRNNNNNNYLYNIPFSKTSPASLAGSDISSSDQENLTSGSSNIINTNNNLKFMSMMMEEDRQCTRNQGHRSRSTSPASSVGEERLWRPW